MAIERRSHLLISKQSVIVASICIILVSSLLIVDMATAGHEFALTEPSFVHDFPETVVFYNITEGISSNIFSFIVDFPVNHSGHHHIVPREISLLFWFRDATDGTDISPLVEAVLPERRNGTFSISNHDYDQVDRKESGWWAPSLINVAFNDQPDVDYLRFGLQLKLILLNIIEDDFNGHELETRLEMNVTYSRWWFGLKIVPSHQMVTYNFNLSDSGFTTIQSLEYGVP